MALVSPFKGWHYNPEKLSNLSDLITPPYDVIPKGAEAEYYARNPYNFAQLILPKKPDDDYILANQYLQKWKETKVVRQDPYLSYYLYRQTFTLDGKTHTRDSLMCLVLLHDFAEAIIRPHENTHGKYKADRLQILRATQHNLSHIFGMVKDEDGILEMSYEQWAYDAPLFQATSREDNVQHTVWRKEASKATEIEKFFENQPIYIVDGHHRYESALQYAREKGALGNPQRPEAYLLFAIANSYDPGLVILPTHRYVTQVEKPISLSDVGEQYELTSMTTEELSEFVVKPQETPKFAMFIEGQLFQCSPKYWVDASDSMGSSVAKLSVAWSDTKFLKEFCGIDEQNRTQKIQYEKDWKPLWEKRNAANVVIFHAPPKIEDVTSVADEKRFMPQKSTFFYPKLAAGLVFREVR